jgi:hypothetical protein
MKMMIILIRSHQCSFVAIGREIFGKWANDSIYHISCLQIVTNPVVQLRDVL